MPADYSKFRTPFFEIEIGDSQGNNMTPLPPQIARLVEKVDINETLCCNSFNQITLVFNEGSREPYPIDQGSYAPNSIYPTGGQQGALSNKSGMLTDLRLSSGGLTTVPPIEIPPFPATALSVAEVGALLGKVNTPPAPDVEPPSVPVPTETDIHFLLQQRNQVKVKWGYKESPSTVRIASAYVMMVTSEFPENGTPKVTVVCHDSASGADQLVTNKSRRFSLPIPTGVSETDGKPLFENQDMPIHLVLAEFCNVTECIISPKFRAEFYEETKTKQWFAGHSLHQFLSEMARRHNAVYKFLIDHETGKDVLVFISREDWEKFPIIGDETLFTYRGNGSLIKSINIRADYGAPIGTFLKGINDEGQHVIRDSNYVTQTIFDPEKQQDNPSNGAANQIELTKKATAASRGGVTGAAQVSAETSPENLKDLARNNTIKQGHNLVSLDFSCLGYTFLTPGTLKFSGIGERYTGFYNVKTVTHSLGSDGYQCKGTAISFKNSRGGVDLKDDKVQQGDEKISLDVFEAVPTAMGQYHDRMIKSGGAGQGPTLQ